MEYPDDVYTDEEEYQDNVAGPQREIQESQIDEYGFPQAKKNDNLFTLFKDVIAIRDSSKVSNLNPRELGDLSISVRDCQQIALLGDIFGHKKFAEFYGDRGEITLATSSSKKGWLVELFVTSKKFAAKSSTASSEGITSKKKKWSLFGKKTEEV